MREYGMMGMSVVMDEGGTTGGDGGGGSGGSVDGCGADTDERGEGCVETAAEVGEWRDVELELPLSAADGGGIDTAVAG